MLAVFASGILSNPFKLALEFIVKESCSLEKLIPILMQDLTLSLRDIWKEHIQILQVGH